MSLTRHLVEEYPNNAVGRQAFTLISSENIGLVLALIDLVVIVTASVFSAYAYHRLALAGDPYIKQYFGIGSVSAVVFISLVATRDLYKINSLIYFPVQARRIIFPWIIVVSICCLILFLFKNGANYSRGALSIFSIAGLALLIGSRYVIALKLNAALADSSLSAPLAITIGDAESLSHLPETQILQRWGLREAGRSVLPKIGDFRRDEKIVDDAIEAARSHNVQFVLLALKWSSGRRRDLISERLQILPIPVLLLPDEHIRPLLAQGLSQIGSELAVIVQRAPLSLQELAIKRALDLVIAGTILIAIAPLLAMVSLLIKLNSPGPVIFRQRRKGFNGSEFVIYKFRTMNVLEDGPAFRQAQRDDARVTRIGRILRVTSIDELPQLVNVLLGHMSLVGPRPHPIALDNGCSKVIAKYAFRQHVKPGLTGWAQVKGFRGETAKLELMEQRVAHDLWYVKNWSIWLDLRIIIRTFFVLLRPKNAY